MEGRKCLPEKNIKDLGKHRSEEMLSEKKQTLQMRIDFYKMRKIMERKTIDIIRKR